MSTALESISTERIYYQNTYRFTLPATIVAKGSDEKGSFVIFDKTIFHPQGGGQPNDPGLFLIDTYRFPVVDLEAPKNPNAIPYPIKHYYETSNGNEDLIKVQIVALQIIDKKARARFARWHSAGHIISNALHFLYPALDGCSGNHFPGEAFVIFKGEPIPEDLKEVQKQLQAKVNAFIQDSYPVNNQWQQKPRMVQFGALPAYPCGGTHVQNSAEIGEIEIRNVKKEKMKKPGTLEKEAILKVKYTLKEVQEEEKTNL